VRETHEGWATDDVLLAALREAVRARRAVPATFIDAGKNAYAWHNVDPELVRLTYDSSYDLHRIPSVRSEAASVRALTFTSARFVIELEVTEEGLLGQVMPPHAGTVEAESQVSEAAAVPLDDIGCFSIEPPPTGPFRLRWKMADGTDLVTGWITL